MPYKHYLYRYKIVSLHCTHSEMVKVNHISLHLNQCRKLLYLKQSYTNRSQMPNGDRFFGSGDVLIRIKLISCYWQKLVGKHLQNLLQTSGSNKGKKRKMHTQTHTHAQIDLLCQEVCYRERVRRWDAVFLSLENKYKSTEGPTWDSESRVN